MQRSPWAQKMLKSFLSTWRDMPMPMPTSIAVPLVRKCCNRICGLQTEVDGARPFRQILIGIGTCTVGVLSCFVVISKLLNDLTLSICVPSESPCLGIHCVAWCSNTGSTTICHRTANFCLYWGISKLTVICLILTWPLNCLAEGYRMGWLHNFSSVALCRICLCN
jgi:hypothetical protein